MLKINIMDKTLKRYLKNEFHHGKNIIARAFDLVFSRIIIFAVIFILLWSMHLGILRSAILALCTTICISMIAVIIRKKRYEKFIEKRFLCAKSEYVLEKLILLDPAPRQAFFLHLFSGYLDKEPSCFTRSSGGFICENVYCRFFTNHPKYPVTVEQMASLCRKLKNMDASSSVLMSAGGYKDDAEAMAIRQSKRIILLGREELISLVGDTDLDPSYEELYEYITSEIAQKAMTRERLKKAFLDVGKGRAFAMCSIILIAWSFIFGFNIIYPIMAVICGLISVYSFFKSRKTG